MLPRRPPFLDPAFHRIAKRLRVLELMSDKGPTPSLSLDDVEISWDSPDGRGRSAFLNFYSKDGLLLGMKAYGIHDKLVALGLGDYELEVTREDAFYHRLELFVGGGHDDEHRIMDLRVHLRQVMWPGSDDDEAEAHVSYPVLVIEWLAMRNPLGRFTPERPRLPGQSLPGSGLGRAIHNVLVIMAERTRRAAILNVPEHFHLAALYLRAGYRYPSLERELEVRAVLDATHHLHFAAAAWAVERGFVLSESDGRRVKWRYVPEEMVLPLSPDIRRRLPGTLERLAERVLYPRAQRYVLDAGGLQASLREDPVEGLEGYQVPSA